MKTKVTIVYEVDGEKKSIVVKDVDQGELFMNMMKKADPKCQPRLVEE